MCHGQVLSFAMCVGRNISETSTTTTTAATRHATILNKLKIDQSDSGAFARRRRQLWVDNDSDRHEEHKDDDGLESRTT